MGKSKVTELYDFRNANVPAAMLEITVHQESIQEQCNMLAKQRTEIFESEGAAGKG